VSRRLFLALCLASALAVSFLYASGATAAPVERGELHADAGDVSFVGLVGGPVRGAVHPSGLRFEHEDLEGGATVTVVRRSAAARRRARRRVRDTRDHTPVPVSRPLPFVFLAGACCAVSGAAFGLTRPGDLRLPAKRGPPSASTSSYTFTTEFPGGPAGGRSLPARQKVRKRSRRDLDALRNVTA
jgi:hypothetical protein